ncbi:hypothetical protein B0H16DRAFT_1737760 [Mycena metata]|uniref:Hydrophobic surface binding protein n=1 Tax=Mycena metata TaxID=1033252 RepID=A0AAD7HKJ3_9AGAR|nr:hypothetical protein B0H16DRAFT_1737760 [Mycena metata]
MIQLSRALILFAVASVGLALSVKSDGSTLANDLANIIADVETLDTEIAAFPPPNNSQALDALQGIPGSLSPAATTAILAQVDALLAVTNKTLVAIVAKKPSFAALPIGGVTGLIRTDLSALSAASSNFCDAVVSKCSADRATDCADRKTRFITAFQAAIVDFN